MKNISILATTILNLSPRDLRPYSSGRHSAASSNSLRNSASAVFATSSEHTTAFRP